MAAPPPPRFRTTLTLLDTQTKNCIADNPLPHASLSCVSHERTLSRTSCVAVGIPGAALHRRCVYGGGHLDALPQLGVLVLHGSHLSLQLVVPTLQLADSAFQNIDVVLCIFFLPTRDTNSAARQKETPQDEGRSHSTRGKYRSEQFFEFFFRSVVAVLADLSLAYGDDSGWEGKWGSNFQHCATM